MLHVFTCVPWPQTSLCSSARFSAGPERQFQNHHIADPYAPVGQGLSR